MNRFESMCQLYWEDGARRVQRFLAVAAMAFMTGNAGAQTLVQSTFDADSQGWTSVGFNASGTAFASPSLTWVGSAGGAVRYDSPINPPYTAFFLAPVNIEAALHSAIGGGISRDLSTTHARKPFAPLLADLAASLDNVCASITGSELQLLALASVGHGRRAGRGRRLQAEQRQGYR